MIRKDPLTVIALDKLQLNEGQLDWLPKNPRSFTQTDLDRTKRSLDEDADFLQERPLLAVPGPDKTLVVFAGNLRLTAARALGWPGAPVVVYHPEDQIDRETILRRALKDNGSFGSWDPDTLANDWNTDPWLLEQWGVPDWITGGAGGAQQPGAGGGTGAGSGEPSAKEDENFDPDKGILVRCKPGDIWQLGEHRLMCGDSTDLETVKALMDGGGELADMVFTDPPYGVAIGDKNKTLHEFVGGNQVTENLTNDTLAPDELYQVLKPAFDNLRQNCKEDATYFVCAPPGGDVGLRMMMMMMADAGLRPRHQIVWNKSAATFSLGRLDYDYKHEAILYTWTKKHHNYRISPFRTSVWDIEKPRRCDLHPTMKPVELVAAAMQDGSKEGDVVLDLFGGSGTTLVVAEQLGRKARLMEIDPHYCDVILSRWEQLTGRTATKLN